MRGSWRGRSGISALRLVQELANLALHAGAGKVVPVGDDQAARVALFFCAGRGLRVDGRNYLLAVDANLEATSDLGFETIGLDNILESLDGASHTNIIILDACRNNPFARRFA
jgi:uncharacterized caspase-like protein